MTTCPHCNGTGEKPEAKQYQPPKRPGYHTTDPKRTLFPVTVMGVGLKDCKACGGTGRETHEGKDVGACQYCDWR